MSKIRKIIFLILLVYFIFHTIRDVLQILNLYGNPLADLLKTNHSWCRPYCDYVTLPPDLLGIIGSVIVLNRNKTDLIGVFVILAFLSIQIGFLLP